MRELEIPVNKVAWWRNRWWVLLIAVTTLLLLGRVIYNGILHSKQLAIASAVVSRGEVQKHIIGYGRLLARQQGTVITEVEGSVAELILLPGAQVQPGAELLRLRNPAVLRELETAELQLLDAMATRESSLADFTREQQQLLNDVALAESEQKLATQELQTMQVLMEQKILARLEFLRAETRLEQANMKARLATGNLQSFEQTRNARTLSLQYKLQQAQKLTEMARTDVDNLLVKADRAGVLADLPEDIQLGQAVAKGVMVAKINDPTSLYADVRVSAAEAAQLQPGQPAEVSVKGQAVAAVVSRVYPTVSDNQVRVELELTGALPAEARINFDIVARVTTAAVDQVARVEVPAHITGPGRWFLHVRQQEVFARQSVEIGVVGNRYMEIISGLQPGEEILLQVPAALQQRQAIKAEELVGG
jgi:HlyD family secretion protein